MQKQWDWQMVDVGMVVIHSLMWSVGSAAGCLLNKTSSKAPALQKILGRSFEKKNMRSLEEPL